MALKQSVKNQIVFEHSRAPRGAKTEVVKRWADFLGCSVNRIWTVIPTDRKRSKETDKTEDLQEITKIVFQIKHRVPDGTPPLSTDQAYEIAMKNKIITGDIPRYSIASINRMARQLKLNKKTRRIQRFQAERPNEMHHVDASTSNHFYAVKVLPDGDFLLKLHGPSQNYKNKPTPIHQRVWIYGIVDDYSGCAFAEYIVAPGESEVDNLTFLKRAWTVSDDKTFCGLPDKIKGDKGPMMRGRVTKDLFERFNVETDPSVPGAKDTHGKIERPWRTHWQRFERQFLVVDDWKKFEITLSELNRQLLNYLQNEYNLRKHRFEKEITREQAWKKINLYGGIRPLPADAFNTAHEKVERKVRRDGTFSLDNKLYEVKGLHDAKVNVLTCIFTGKMMVQEIETGEKYEVIEFKSNPIGKFTAHPHTPYQKNKKAAQDLHITGSLFEEKKEPTNVVPMPIREQGEQTFDHVFDIGAYASLKDAMADFSSMTGIYPEADSEQRRTLEKLFMKNELRREFVRGIADQCVHEQEAQNWR